MKDKISQRVQQLFESGHLYDDTVNVNIREDIMENLLPYQTLHTFNMITALKNNTVVIDSSYTGTGKTYTTAAACAQLNLVPFVICPKSIINKWKEVFEIFNLEYISIVNYETIRGKKYYDMNGCKLACPYIKREKNSFVWDFSERDDRKRIVMIFDEVHRCKNHKALNGKLLLSCKNLKTMMLSATLCDKNSDFGIFGMMLGFYKNFSQGKNWIDSVIREDRIQYGKKKTNTLHKYLFPDKGSKMSLEDLGESFPMNQISIDCYTLEDSLLKKINRYYDLISKDTTGDSTLPELVAMRQKIENTKTVVLLDLLTDYYDQNRSVVMFVNYRSTHDIITEYLKKQGIGYAEIHGNQTEQERTDAINTFQNNEVRVIVSMIQAGGTSISLHDVSGRFPRVSIISPSYSSIELVQTLGRIHRAGVKSPCLQKVVYCADTCEEDVANILKRKKNFMKTVTDEDINVERKVIMRNLRVTDKDKDRNINMGNRPEDLSEPDDEPKKPIRAKRVEKPKKSDKSKRKVTKLEKLERGNKSGNQREVRTISDFTKSKKKKSKGGALFTIG